MYRSRVRLFLRVIFFFKQKTASYMRISDGSSNVCSSDLGKAYVTIAFGCTGGRHRSVHVTERVAARLRQAGFSPTVSHRNLESTPLDALENRPEDDDATG